MSDGLPWFRVYTNIVDNHKMRLLAFEDRWHFIAIMACKQSGIFENADAEFVNRSLAVKLGLQLPALDELKKRLKDVNLVDKNWDVIKWEERQYKSDSSKERQRKYREKQKVSKSVTEPKRHQNAKVTTQDTDTDTDTEADTDKEINVERERESTKPQRTRSLATASLLVNKINQINPAWLTMPVLSAKETIAYQTNELSLRAATGEAWDALRGYYAAKLPEGKPSYRPKSREKLIADFPDVITYAIQWEQSKVKPTAKKAIKQEEGEDATAEDIAAIFGNIRKS